MSLRDLLARRGGIGRRAFVAGSVAATAAATAAVSLSGCGGGGKKKKETSGEPEVIKDSSKIVAVLDDYKEADLKIEISGGWTLPLGTLLWHSEGTWAAAILTPESAVHPNTLGAVSVSSGSATTLIAEPAHGRGHAFHDVRCSTGVYAWVEMDYLKGDWYLLAQAFADGALSGDAVELDHGNADWEPAKFCCTGSTVYWLKMPLASGSKSSEDSHCKGWTVGDGEGSSKSVYTSHGRFATPPRVADDVLTITPRVLDDEGTYYGMTALDLTDGRFTQLDQLILPAGVRPFDAVYTGKAFAFSIEASYDGAGSLGNMGTYIGREGGPYVYFGREPAAQVCYTGERYLIKTQSAHYVVDVEKESYQGISSPDRAINMGDFPASEGACGSPLVYATIRDTKGIPTSVTARILTL